MSPVLNVLLTHQPPVEVAEMLAWWKPIASEANILIVHGGARGDFEQLAFAHKVFVDDERLRTTDHQREMQSYTAVLRAVSAWMCGADFTHVYFSEYDHLPLVPDLNAKQVEFIRQEQADLLGHQILRVDGTNQPHYLYHAGNPDFAAYWRSVSKRRDAATVLSMFGSGSFWTREAFDAVAAFDEPFPMYLEVRLPTLAHHLGFRVRDFGAQNRFVKNLGDFADDLDTARRAGAWTVHPVKELWRERAAAQRPRA